MDNLGTLNIKDGLTVSYQIIDRAAQSNIDTDKSNFLKNNFIKYGDHFKFGDYTVATHGDYNTLPQDCVNIVRYNPYLPEILKKQVRIIYGQGPYLFNEDFDDDNRKIRIPHKRKAFRKVWDWLDSWKANGLPQSADEYIKKVLFEMYYMEGYYDKVHKNRSRRTGGPLPIRGLESLNGVKCRLVMPGTLKPSDMIEDKDCTHVMYGRWDLLYRFDMEVYPRYNEANPFKNAIDIDYVADKGFDEDIYAIPTSYYGLVEWIRGANLDPKYINSYLKNSLSAKIHVVIPDEWVRSKQKTLQDICNLNQEREQAGKDLITTYETLTNIGTVYSSKMLEKLIEGKIREATDLLSGEGENQGKAFWSQSFMTERGLTGWEFKEIPVKYKEFVSSILEYDKRAMEVIIAGKGLDPSISNVSSSGIFTNSGSQVYYNYLVYLDTLPYPESIALHSLNNKLHLNFPELKEQGIRLGLYRNTPQRQEETPPKDRFENTVNK